MSGATERADDLVEDQQRVELVAELANLLIEGLVHGTRTALGSDRLDDDRGELVGVPVDQRGGGLGVVAFVLLVGVLIGTYSSIYVASTSILMLGVSKADLMPVKKEGVVDDRP